MSLRKTEDLQQSESGLSLLQGLFILAIIGVVATVIVSSSSDATTCPCHNVWSSPPREPACRLASRACAGQAARALPGVHGRTPHLTTRGDQILDRTLSKVGGKGLSSKSSRRLCSMGGPTWPCIP